MAERGYIDKAECLRRGFVRGADGLYRKLTVLERYGKNGWLDFGDKRYSAMDRISAGSRLARDFYLSRLEAVCANDIRKVRVDGCGSSVFSEKILDARDRFNKACAAIPHEFWGIVNKVCCEDKELEADAKAQRQRLYQKHTMVTLLCLGLDRLIEHYRNNGQRGGRANKND